MLKKIGKKGFENKQTKPFPDNFGVLIREVHNEIKEPGNKPAESIEKKLADIIIYFCRVAYFKKIDLDVEVITRLTEDDDEHIKHIIMKWLYE